jgi:alpha-D-xyloside xylohydrolase
MNTLKAVLVLTIILGAQTLYGQIAFTRDSVGVTGAMAGGNTLYVKVCSPSIIRVVYVAGTAVPADTANYIVVNGSWAPTAWDTTQTSTTLTINTDSLQVNINKTSGAVSFLTAAGVPIVNEIAGSKSLTPVTISNVSAYAGAFAFNAVSGEGLYGFGQFQNSIVNQFGVTDSLAQHNQTDCSPVFLSTRGFGVLWINYSRGEAASSANGLNLSCAWATNNAIDYYFIYGPQFDRIISGYRTITGQASMWPKWAYGFWQCRNYYASQSEFMTVVKTYRSKNYPIDNIVQDWNYYPSGFNGCQCFDPSRYPNVAAAIDTLHDSLHCHFTISVWPSFTSTAGNNNYTFMNSRGYLLPVNDYLGQTYDAFNDSAAFYYWKFIDDSLVSKNIDGFWPDATEPESVGWPYCGTALGPGVEYGNMFPFLHSKTLHDGFKSAFSSKKRVCNLTRSYYAGSQRLGAAYWTGDVGTTFSTLQAQIPAGLDFCMTGMPYFTTDIGGFTGTNTAELEIRWFEWGSFNSVFRVHGTRACNQVWCWNDATGGNLSPLPQTESILVNYLNLRYRLFPYIYSMAGMVTQQNYTIMRALAFDFPNDPNVYNLSYEFMFGPAFLVCPVYTSQATSIPVYLPSATWYNFWTGDTLVSRSGRNITANAPLDTMPLFIRSGSIVPMGPEIKYADSAEDPIELRVYTGANGTFNLYEDENDNYDYEGGTFATIPIVWNDATDILTVGPTNGSFPGMLQSRTFKIVWVSHHHGVGESVTPDSVVDRTFTYGGSTVTIDKFTGQIKVKPEPPKLRTAQYTLRQSRGMLIGALGGNQAWDVRVTTLQGREIVARTIRGGTQSVIARGLSAGAYLVSLRYNGSVIANKSIFIQ